jgi:hypothetical protein
MSKAVQDLATSVAAWATLVSDGTKWAIMQA